MTTEKHIKKTMQRKCALSQLLNSFVLKLVLDCIVCANYIIKIYSAFYIIYKLFCDVNPPQNINKYEYKYKMHFKLKKTYPIKSSEVIFELLIIRKVSQIIKKVYPKFRAEIRNNIFPGFYNYQHFF